MRCVGFAQSKGTRCLGKSIGARQISPEACTLNATSLRLFASALGLLGCIPEAICLSLNRYLYVCIWTCRHACAMQVHEADDDAEWRSSRITTEDFLRRQMETGRRISQFFSVFGVFIYLFRVDWLHAVDLGVGADFAGNVFEALLPKLPGGNKEARCHVLNDKLQAFYDGRGTEDRLKVLTVKNFKRASKGQNAKLKGSASQVRAAIPFVKELADELVDDSVPAEAAIKIAAKHLTHCYQALARSSEACRDEAFYSSSQGFVLQCQALHLAGDGVAFRSKPKTHMFLEMCSQPGVVPNSCWCYRDEDFGGPIARQSEMRGRWKNLTAYSGHAFDMFFMKNAVPRIVEVTI